MSPPVDSSEMEPEPAPSIFTSIETPGDDYMDLDDESESTEPPQSAIDRLTVDTLTGASIPSEAQRRSRRGKVLEEEIPATPPTAAITQALPPKVADWNEDRSAPTDTFQKKTPCPFDWDYIAAQSAGKLTDDHIQAYVRRAPWNPVAGQKSFNTVMRELKNEGYKSVSCEETVRKRFARANSFVYQATGVYFENNCLGVDKDYDLRARKVRVHQKHSSVPPAPGNYYDALTDHKNSRVDVRNLYEFILQPADPAYDDRCKACCDVGWCYDEGCREDDCCDDCCDKEFLCDDCVCYGQHQRNCRHPDCGEEQECQCPCVHQAERASKAHSAEGYKEKLASIGAPFGCHQHEPRVSRSISKDLWDNVSHRRLEGITLLHVHAKPFDIITSCIVLGVENGVPPRLLRLDWDVGYPENYMVYTPSDILKAYCCAQILQCPAISDVLLNHLAMNFKAKEDPSSARFSIADFQPEDINYVFRNTSTNDPIRMFLLDLVSAMRQEGRKKVHKKETEYHPIFLMHWMARESELLSNLHRSPNHPANREQIAAIMKKFHTFDKFQTAIAEQQKLSTATSEQHGLVGVLEWMPNTPEAAGFGPNGTIDAEELYYEYKCSPDLIWNKFFFRGWLPNPACYKNRSADTEKDLRARLTRADSFLIDIDFYPEEFCHHYHNDCPEKSSCLHKPIQSAARAGMAALQGSDRRRILSTALVDEDEFVPDSPPF